MSRGCLFKLSALALVCTAGLGVYRGLSDKKERNDNLELTFLSAQTKFYGSGMMATIDFDADGNYKEPEYRAILYFDKTDFSYESMGQYKQKLNEIPKGTKATLRTWQMIAPSIFELEK